MTKRKRISLIVGGGLAIVVIIGVVVLLNSRMFSEWLFFREMYGEYTTVGVANIKNVLVNDPANLYEFTVKLDKKNLTLIYDSSIVKQDNVTNQSIYTIATDKQKPIYIDSEYFSRNDNCITDMLAKAPFLLTADTINGRDCVVVELYDEMSVIKFGERFYYRNGAYVSELIKS